MRIYSLLDRKLKEYGSLVLGNNDEAVKRAIKDGIPGSNNVIAAHPEDFDLYYLGDFDMESGLISACKVPILVDCVSTVLAGLPGQVDPQLSLIKEA